MSGGSFDYLYQKSLEEAVGTWGITDMRDFLRENGGADAAAEIDAILATMEALRPRWDALAKHLGVFHAAEWYRSCDWGPEDLAKALNAWRASHVSFPPTPAVVE